MVSQLHAGLIKIEKRDIILYIREGIFSKALTYIIGSGSEKRFVGINQKLKRG